MVKEEEEKFPTFVFIFLSYEYLFWKIGKRE
jgi:hypothetical protein